TVSYIWPMVLGAAVWLPLALWSLAGLAQKIGKGNLGPALAVDLPIGALAIALGVLGGHLEITFYATFVVGLYALYLAGRFLVRRRRGASGGFLAAAGLVIGLGVLIGAVQLTPFLSILGSNNRQGETTYSQVISYALPHRRVLGFLMPDFFGNPTAHDYFDLTTLQETPVGNNALGKPTDPPRTIDWGTKNYVEAGGYVGVVSLLLAVIGALFSRHRDRWFFVGLAALSLLLAFGTPLYALIYYGLPFFSQLRTPFRWLYPFDFSAAVLAGLGADWLWRGGVASPPRPLSIGKGEGAGAAPGAAVSSLALALPWLPAGLGVLGLGALAVSFLERRRSVALAGRILAARADLQRAFGSGAVLYSYEFRNLAIFFGLLAIGGLLVGLLATMRGRGGKGGVAGGPRGVVAALLVLLVVGDLFYFGTRFVSEEPPSILAQRVDLSSVLPPNLAGPRVATLGDPEVLQPNLGVILGVPSIAAYDTIIPSRFVSLWSLVEPPGDLPYNKIGLLHHASSLASPILDLLSVRYVLTESPVDNPSVRLVGRFGAIRVYERPSALPRAFVVSRARWVPGADAALAALKEPGFRPGQEVVLEGSPGTGRPKLESSIQNPEAGTEVPGAAKATITSYQLDRVDVEAAGPGWLVVTDGNSPGWQATVDGAAAPILMADGDLRAVALAAGTHRVVFQYSPLPLRIGAYLTFLGLIVLGLVATWPLWRRTIGHYTGQAERVLRNTTLPMFTSFLNKAVDFGFAALMLRILGPKDVGDYAIAIMLMGYFEIFTNFGLNALITREVSRDRAVTGRYLADAVAARLGLCVIAAPVVGAIALVGHRWLNLGDQGVVAFLLLTLALVPGNVSAALTALFNAWERNEVPAAVSVAINLARVTLGTAALLIGAGIVGLAAIALLLNFVIVIAFAVLARRALVLRLAGPVPKELPQMLAESWPLMLNQALVTIFFKVDFLMLEIYKGSETVGYYSAAYKWLDGFLIVPSTFTFAIYPALSRYAEQAGEGLRKTYEVSARILVTLGVPITVAIAFLSGDLILLLGGQAYYPMSARALSILICFLPFSYLNGVTQYALIAVNRQRFITVAFVISAAFNVGANLILIPRFGLYGASAVTVASEIVLMVPFLYAVRQSIGEIDWLATAGKPILAGTVMALIAWGGRMVEPHLALLVGAAVYLGMLWLLRVFSPAELAVLSGLVGAIRKRTSVATGAEA
ncbi:MAG: oligosaccharide flippase family protein, partial [Chloroflexota bacterium]